MIPCKKCGFKHINESNVASHHIVPKFCGGTDKDGRLYLCGENKGNDCHRELHKRWNEILKPLFIKMTEDWLKE